VYRPVPGSQIADILTHLRALFRQIKPSSEQEFRAHERREVVTKNLLSNLLRMKEHPTLNAVLEVADIFSLTLDGAHRIFGYSLEGIRDYDFKLNGGRTHIIESYPSRVISWLICLRDSAVLRLSDGMLPCRISCLGGKRRSRFGYWRKKDGYGPVHSRCMSVLKTALDRVCRLERSRS
jgi:hypothetical protein